MFLDLRLFVPKILHTATSQQRFVTVSIKYHRGDLMGSRVSFGPSPSTRRGWAALPRTLPRRRLFMKRIALFAAAWLLLSVTAAFAQGVQTGTIRGVVKDPQDLPVPGVSVSVTSPALQGVRTTTTDAQGLYVLQALPAGDYQVKFDIQGFSTVTRAATVPLGLVVEQNVTLRPGAVTET